MHLLTEWQLRGFQQKLEARLLQKHIILSYTLQEPYLLKQMVKLGFQKNFIPPISNTLYLCLKFEK